MKKTGLMSFIISSAIAFNSVMPLFFTYNESYAADSAINVAEHTPQEIKEYIDSHPFDKWYDDGYSVSPSMSYPYAAGSLDDKSLQNALNTLNCIRYIAGLQEVSINSRYNELTQAAALVNCVNGTLEHNPSQPSDMPDDIFSLAVQGASSSNLFCAISSIPIRLSVSYSILSYMDDSDISNISRVGHRRWCLNPAMLETGFGAVNNYSAMYAFDRQRSATETGVCWPAKNMPTEYFDSDTAWSISMGRAVDESSVIVTLTRKSDGQEWNFSSTSSDGDFYIDNSSRGQSGCIIFRPDGISCDSGDVFDVKIEGMENPVEYTVNFFSLSGLPDDFILGDVNNDGFVDSSDASDVLEEYALLSTGKSGNFSDTQKKSADVNSDGITDASDASSILGFYSYLSTENKNITMEEWLLL